MSSSRPNGPASLADQWRSHLGVHNPEALAPVEIVLPSGMSIRANRTTVLLMIQRGQIPEPLVPRLHQMISLAQSSGAEAVRAEFRTAAKADPAAFVVEWHRILDAVWLAAVVEPRFTDAITGDEGDAIPVAAVDEDDKVFVFRWLQGESMFPQPASESLRSIAGGFEA